MSKPLMMIINPAAGKCKFREGLAEALKLLSDAGYTTSIFFTERRGHAAELAAEHASDFERVLVLGGDGTLGEAVAGLMRLESRPQIGYIPIGTANDIARTFGFVKGDIVEGTRRFITGKSFAFDTGHYQGGYFNYVAAFGSLADVSYGTPQNLKNQFGQAAYLTAAGKALLKLKPIWARVEYDGGVMEGEFIHGGVNNSFSLGGVVDMPPNTVELDDGLFELALIRQTPGLTSLAGLAARVLTHHYDSEYLTIVKTARAKFTFAEPQILSLDGEMSSPMTELDFEICPKAVEIIC
ncbi:MAG: YegS/Rv2252/BmrU family lipid kinase [Oscillospiraceae bacterium]|nr:YegS/Rv2252/BmrU family lipid kinase [Oscillospiraceae bacterium]